MARTSLAIWQEFSGPLRALVGMRVSNPFDIEDILQDIFVKIHTWLGTLRDDERVAAWLYQIARNAIADYFRALRDSLAIPETLALESDPDDRASIAQMSIGLVHLIETLPDRYREALLLAELQGLSQQAVAEKLGLSLSGAKSRVQRGRKLLRAALLACCHFRLDHRGNRRRLLAFRIVSPVFRWLTTCLGHSVLQA